MSCATATRSIAVEPQVFDLLAYLIAHRDRVVDKRELLDEVWGTRFVTESALTSRVKAARRAVGDSGQEQWAIRTTHGRGYRFVADVVELPDRPGTVRRGRRRPRPASVDRAQDVRFCRDRRRRPHRLRLGGEGPPFVKAANWLTHVRYSWESIVWCHWLRDLSAHHRLLHYDQRGVRPVGLGPGRRVVRELGERPRGGRGRRRASIGSRCSASARVARWPPRTPPGTLSG